MNLLYFCVIVELKVVQIFEKRPSLTFSSSIILMYLSYILNIFDCSYLVTYKKAYVF